MHAREADVARQKGRYAAGWQALRRERYERMRRMGLLPKEWALSPDDSAPWDDLSPEMKAWHQRRMEVYAAMVEVMDDGIGRIVAALQAAGQLDRTLLVFLQDNGGCAEEYGSKGAVKPDPARPVTLKPMAPDELQRKMQPDVTRDGRPVRTGEGVMPGPPDTYVAYGREWANVSNTPFRMYKHWVHEGGVATPLIVHWPDGFSRRGEFERQPGHLIDLMATFADVAGAAYPADVDGRPVTPLEGRSLVPALAGRTIEREAIYWEHEGNRAVRQGRWKLVAKGAAGPWELYDMAADRSELKDLAADDPDRVRNMAALWDAWAKRANVLPWPWDGDDSRTAFSNQTHFELTGGDSLPRTRAPMVAGRPVRVAAAVEAKGPDGVIVAQGGTSLGWALYLAGGRAAFAVRSKGKGTFVVAPDPLPAGRADVGATLAADGTVTLTVGGRTVATGKADGPVASMPLDGLEVGRDDGGAVGPYAAPNVFKGRIEKVVIDVGP
jgi:arylsulfatase